MPVSLYNQKRQLLKRHSKLVERLGTDPLLSSSQANEIRWELRDLESLMSSSCALETITKAVNARTAASIRGRALRRSHMVQAVEDVVSRLSDHGFTGMVLVHHGYRLFRGNPLGRLDPRHCEPVSEELWYVEPISHQGPEAWGSGFMTLDDALKALDLDQWGG